MNFIRDFFESILSLASNFGIFDVLDIAIVSIIFYYIYKFVRDRRAGKLAIGILFVFLIMFLSNAFNMQALSFLVENVVQVGIIGIIILFQSELRSFLEKMGGKSLKGFNLRKDSTFIKETLDCIDEVCKAVTYFSEEKVGSLIVFERDTKLGDVIKTGTVIDAKPEAFLIKNIFFSKAPLHDGALIIRGNRLYSAGCFLPLSLNTDIIRDLGTRHRAAIGMSENSDAIVVVVSEETGTISIALDGHLIRDFDINGLRDELVNLLVSENMSNPDLYKDENTVDDDSLHE